MGNKKTLWTLNRATGLVLGMKDKIEMEIEGGILDRLFGDDLELTFGTRRNREVGGKKLRNKTSRLMYEDDDFSEYFVPIAVKCIGDRTAAKNQPLLDGILAANSALFDNLPSFWEEAQGPVGKVGMATRGDYTGLYDLLADSGNILIGYSQGGLVARYLAFLDEHVFGEERIDAIITIGAPNYGSPLANPDNQERVIDGLVQALLAILGKSQKDNPVLSAFLRARVDYDAIMQALLDLHAELKAPTKLQPGDKDTRDLVATSLKWLSGLARDDFSLTDIKLEHSAFHDLSVDTFAKPHSVLSLVNDKQYKLDRILQGAIINADNRLDHIIAAGLSGFKRAGFTLIDSLTGLGDSVDAAGTVYSAEVMREGQDYNIKTIAELQSRYDSGFKPARSDRSIAARAHDFVIPSVCQRLPQGKTLIGNLVNPDANHLSGSDLAYEAGQKNADLLLQLIDKIEDELQ